MATTLRPPARAPNLRLAAWGLWMLLGACATPAPLASTTDTTTGSSPANVAAGHHGLISWAPWTPETFAVAAAERRLVIVTVVTEWCHWCHVMDEQTWGDPAVAALVAERFVAIRVDADARPDLAERYAEWGWPAIALLTPDAQRVTEWKGYQEARRFEGQLRSFVADLDANRPLRRADAEPTPPAAPLTSLVAARDHTRAQLDRFYDVDQGGWGKRQKYPLWAPLAAGLVAATTTPGSGDAARSLRARRLAEVVRTAEGELHLIDAVDGGMFQYSLKGVWTAPHYEKLAEIQGTAMRSLTDVAVVTDDARFIAGAADVARYVRTVLRQPDGAFSANQDADVGTRGETAKVLGIDWYALPSREARAARGEPFLDEHVYASHNGRLITGLARLAGVRADPAMLGDAVQAYERVRRTHLRGVGDVTLFVHDEHQLGDDEVFYLADQLAMGQAALALAEATGERRYREEARAIAAALLARFRADDGALYAHTERPGAVGVFAERRRPVQHNGEAAHLLIMLGHLEDDAALREAGVAIVNALANPAVIAAEYRAVGELLLAQEAALHEPLHLSVVTSTGGLDDDARALLTAAHRLPTVHRVIDVQPGGQKYPDLGKAVVFVCGSTFCSPPISDPAALAKKASRYLIPE